MLISICLSYKQLQKHMKKTSAAAANLLLDTPGKTPKKSKEKHPSKTSKIKKEIPAKLPPSHDFSLLILPLQKKINLKIIGAN